MTRKTLTSLLLTFSAVLALAGCGGGGLTVGGTALVTDSAHTQSGFTFPAGVHLGSGTAVNTGMCTISRGESGVYGVVVDLYGDSAGEGHAVRSMSIMTHTNASTEGQITADLGGDDFTGACTVVVPHLDEGRGDVTLVVSDCVLTHGTDTVTANVHLDFSSCTVI